MAIVQYTGIVNEVRGKLNGSTFNKSRTINTMSRKQNQTKTPKGFQSDVRNEFSDIQRKWKQLTSAQQLDWQACAGTNPSYDRFGNLRPVSGYNKFIQANLMHRRTAFDYILSPDVAPAPPALISGSTLNYATFGFSNTFGVTLNFSTTVTTSYVGADLTLMVDVSLPYSQGVTNYQGRWVSLGNTTIDGSVGYNVNEILGFHYPNPVADEKVAFRYRLVFLKSGAVVSTEYLYITI